MQVAAILRAKGSQVARASSKSRVADAVKYRLDELAFERDAMRDYIATG